jgi:peptidoglycan/LPS O-acetylase OafA/YrhL
MRHSDGAPNVSAANNPVPQEQRQPTTGYRRDIDGLRAVAVLAVIAYHAIPALAPGGFAGVDIFFVISGYLISGLISKEFDQGTFTFRGFYARRMKRILPAFVVVCLLTSAVSVYLLNVNDLVYFTTSLAACWVFASNIFFTMLSGGYFSPRFELFPLHHTWSLGVEEQFYFVFPLLLALAWRYQKSRLFYPTLILTVAFTALSQAKASDPRAYYLLQFRAHELLIGLLALLARRDFPIRKAVMAETICALGLILTVASVFLLDEHSGFPGVKSLWPCVGAALVIYSADRTTLCRHLLTNRPVVFVGLISYSLYLWHWPIFSFLRYRGIDLTAPVVTFAVALALILSYLSWRFVETPARVNRRITFGVAAVYFYALPALAFGAFGAYSFASGGIPGRVAPEIRELMSSYSRETDLTRDCSTRDIDDATVSLEQLEQKCAFGLLGQPRAQLLLFGDSHANHLKPFVDVLARDAHIKAVYHVMGGCVPTHLADVGGIPPAAEPDTCQQHNSNLLELAGRFRYIVLGGRWSNEAKMEIEAGLLAAVGQITHAGAIAVVFRDTPRFDHDLSQCVLRKARGWMPPETNCNIPYEAVRAEQAPANEAIDHVQEKYPQMVVIDLKELLCNAAECTSRLGNLAVYMDAHHLNSQAAQALAASYLLSHRNPFDQ